MGQNLTQALGEPKARQVPGGREESQAVVRRFLSDVERSVVSSWKGGRRVPKAVSCPSQRRPPARVREKRKHGTVDQVRSRDEKRGLVVERTDDGLWAMGDGRWAMDREPWTVEAGGLTMEG